MKFDVVIRLNVDIEIDDDAADNEVMPSTDNVRSAILNSFDDEELEVIADDDGEYEGIVEISTVNVVEL